MSEHYTMVGGCEGRRYSHISQAWILEASWNDQEEIAYLRSQVADLTAKLAMVKRHAGLDCGDNSCMFAMKISGMRTNGGCRCNPKRWKQDLEESYARIADLTRRLEEAQARAQRPPEPHESVCHACDGSGWVSS